MKETPDAPSRGLGKWGQKGVPRKGWEWVGSEDLGDDRQTCEMCEFAEIRYVHFARHDNYPETLEVGCVCIEHMTEDYTGPRRHEKSMRNSARRRANFPDRKQWRTSRNGNPHIDLDGHHVVITPRGGGWAVSINPPGCPGEWIGGRKVYANERAAKLGAFDGVMWLKERRGR